MGLRKILVIEDSELLQTMYRIGLRRFMDRGAEVIQAFNGLEALRVLEQNPDTDLIILDLVMPIMDGREFLRRWLEDPEHNKTPIIVISTEEAGERTYAGTNGTVVAHMTKPIKINELFALIESIDRDTIHS